MSGDVEVTARGRTSRVLTRRVDGVENRRVPDYLIVEEPMSIRLDGTLVATTMRTPGDDFDLAVGFCMTEGVLGGVPVKGVRYCGEGPVVESAFNDVTVETGGLAPEPTPRLGPASSSCGLCGSLTIEELSKRLEPLEVEPFDLDLLAGLADRIGSDQPLFGATGAVHAAVAFDRSGEPVVEREDIGRHNAVDKVVGHLHLNGLLPATGLGLWVSGRASFELAQKAWAAGFAALVAVSAPSALAVETARIAGFQLAGFARDRRLNLYTGD
ncbi:MAG TPA: formate dehydrogenase accessory sulfurtransferase FdhD [Acidimicrobiales bacterium]|nr:formate dehydrogenase accessory sulfurtransferase FdhD [Acidimicrobiales bacterium]MDP7117905.1 formate dehydrogenase accessory sulfurtransferase FdhD [Acidimicrobiales bacterium]MDP7410607.1 formate dehydrogenase accessory sulfurtransferase FdhD [Acidimicrobiales bacterium]MEE1521251.1 formate dehydrogenase accessory sulfurtransferase FdhD [Acidimicrobiales bacterium]MEE1570758.1 formate dehydrogenase accessory sulfurtransferase FdhD [Acidimicrobiales bacterium]